VINHLEFEAMITNSTKPIHTLVASGPIFSDCLDMAEAVAKANGASSLGEKPFVMPMLNPISPLVYADDTVDKLLIAVDRDVPVICGPMPLAGGTSPATLAGTIALSNAESLFGLVMSQVRRKGAPYVMITFASTMDMMTGDVTSGPEGMLLIAGCLEMGHHYRIPIAGGSAHGGSRGILDGDAGRQQMFGGLTRMLLRGNAGVGIGAGSSLESAVLADETIGMLKVMMKGVPVNDETLALDVIQELGAGSGGYLAHPHTFRHFRALWQPSTVARSSYEGWVAQGRKTTDDYAKERLRDIMRNHQPKPVPDSAAQIMQDIIQEARQRAAASAVA
jgi:trimethylamine--corrinoid protein Co-methyltransferase